jgi:hypothetical protein
MRPLEADFENVKLSDESVSKILKVIFMSIVREILLYQIGLTDCGNKQVLLRMLTNHGTQ